MAQSEERIAFKNKISLGGFFLPGYSDAEISYSRILKHRNELFFSADYIKYDISQEWIGGAGFYKSFSKKDKKFNFHAGIFAAFNYYHYRFYDSPAESDKLKYRYGPIVFLSASPSYKLGKRLSAVFEIKIGEGYQYSNDFHIDNFDQKVYSNYGWTVKAIIDLKAGYSF
jgi:hypothetical protein